MKKTDKKIDKAIVRGLTDVCDIAQQKSSGFVWLTHLVNYNNFPGSLTVICVYDTVDNMVKSQKSDIRELIINKLAAIDIKFTDPLKQISFDCEELCDLENDGNWKRRLSSVG
ncbi:MAG: hypothetical protein V2I33_11115 [Kangiellaceae bacterium]|jgi:hypothetical protein|nr:hypothetical protein [Kangiellaceae bacterium]